jgi:hypothetical protein
MSLFPLALTALLAGAPSGPQHFILAAHFEPAARSGQPGAVAVRFTGTDPEIHINEEPAPRLKLSPVETVLVDKQPPPSGKGPDFDPETARYLDIAKPVRFPVAVAPGAAKGEQNVKATVVYFYCSKREGWCRRGSTEIEVPVLVK